MAKEFRCPNCNQVLTLATKSKLHLDYVCTNKECVNYTSRKKLFLLRLQNLKIKFYDTRIYQKVLFKIVKFFRLETYRLWFKNLKTKIRYGVWFKELANVEHATIKYALKVLKFAVDHQLSWPMSYKTLKEWKKDLKTCQDVLKEFDLFYNDYWKWCEKYKIKLEIYPLITIPYGTSGERQCVFEEKSARERKQEMKDFQFEQKKLREYRDQLKWFVENSIEI